MGLQCLKWVCNDFVCLHLGPCGVVALLLNDMDDTLIARLVNICQRRMAMQPVAPQHCRAIYHVSMLEQLSEL